MSVSDKAQRLWCSAFCVLLNRLLRRGFQRPFQPMSSLNTYLACLSLCSLLTYSHYREVHVLSQIQFPPFLFYTFLSDFHSINTALVH